MASTQVKSDKILYPTTPNTSTTTIKERANTILERISLIID
jgi:hypothetical protein